MDPFISLLSVLLYGIFCCVMGYWAGRNSVTLLTQEDIKHLLVAHLVVRARSQNATVQSPSPAVHSCSHVGQTEEPSVECCRGEAK